MAKEPEKPAPAPEAAAPAEGAAAPAKGGGIMGFVPLILALVLAPAISWALAQYVLFPKLKAQLAAAPAAGGEHGAAPADEHVAPAKAEPAKKPEPKAHGEAKKPEKGGHGEAKAVATEGPGAYRFDSVVVNLAGTMGTRYLKASFLVTGKDTLNERFEELKPQLLDVTLNTLGSLTLADLEEVGSRNLIRARLVSAYNEILGARIVEQIFFSDFVVQ